MRAFNSPRILVAIILLVFQFDTVVLRSIDDVEDGKLIDPEDDKLLSASGASQEGIRRFDAEIEESDKETKIEEVKATDITDRQSEVNDNSSNHEKRSVKRKLDSFGEDDVAIVEEIKSGEAEGDDGISKIRHVPELIPVRIDHVSPFEQENIARKFLAIEEENNGEDEEEGGDARSERSSEEGNVKEEGGEMIKVQKWKEQAMALQGRLKNRTFLEGLKSQKEVLPEMPKFTEMELLNALKAIPPGKFASSDKSYIKDMDTSKLNQTELEIFKAAECLTLEPERKSFAQNILECINGLDVMNCMRILIWPIIADNFSERVMQVLPQLPFEVTVSDYFPGMQEESKKIRASGASPEDVDPKLLLRETSVSSILKEALATQTYDDKVPSQIDPSSFGPILTPGQLEILQLAEKFLPETMREEYASKMNSCVRRFEFFSCVKHVTWPMVKQYNPALPAFPEYQGWYPTTISVYPGYPILPFPDLSDNNGQLPEVIEADALSNRTPRPETVIFQLLKTAVEDQPRNPSTAIYALPEIKSMNPEQLASVQMAQQLVPTPYRADFVDKTVKCIQQYNYLFCTKYSTWPTLRQWQPSLPAFPDFGSMFSNFFGNFQGFGNLFTGDVGNKKNWSEIFHNFNWGGFPNLGNIIGGGGGHGSHGSGGSGIIGGSGGGGSGAGGSGGGSGSQQGSGGSGAIGGGSQQGSGGSGAIGGGSQQASGGSGAGGSGGGVNPQQAGGGGGGSSGSSGSSGGSSGSQGSGSGSGAGTGGSSSNNPVTDGGIITWAGIPGFKPPITITWGSAIGSGGGGSSQAGGLGGLIPSASNIPWLGGGSGGGGHHGGNIPWLGGGGGSGGSGIPGGNIPWVGGSGGSGGLPQQPGGISLPWGGSGDPSGSGSGQSGSGHWGGINKPQINLPWLGPGSGGSGGGSSQGGSGGGSSQGGSGGGSSQGGSGGGSSQGGSGGSQSQGGSGGGSSQGGSGGSQSQGGSGGGSSQTDPSSSGGSSQTGSTVGTQGGYPGQSGSSQTGSGSSTNNEQNQSGGFPGQGGSSQSGSSGSSTNNEQGQSGGYPGQGGSSQSGSGGGSSSNEQGHSGGYPGQGGSSQSGSGGGQSSSGSSGSSSSGSSGSSSSSGSGGGFPSFPGSGGSGINIPSIPGIPGGGGLPSHQGSISWGGIQGIKPPGSISWGGSGSGSGSGSNSGGSSSSSSGGSSSGSGSSQSGGNQTGGNNNSENSGDPGIPSPGIGSSGGGSASPSYPSGNNEQQNSGTNNSSSSNSDNSGISGGGAYPSSPYKIPQMLQLIKSPQESRPEKSLETKVIEILYNLRFSIQEVPYAPIQGSPFSDSLRMFNEDQMMILTLAKSIIPPPARPDLQSQTIGCMQGGSDFIGCTKNVIWPFLRFYIPQLPEFPEDSQMMMIRHSPEQDFIPGLRYPLESLQLFAHPFFRQFDLSGRSPLHSDISAKSDDHPIISVTDTRFTPIYSDHPDTVVLNILTTMAESIGHMSQPEYNSRVAAFMTLQATSNESLNVEQENIMKVAEYLMPESSRQMFFSGMLACLLENKFQACSRDMLWPILSEHYPSLPDYPNFQEKIPDNQQYGPANPISETDVKTGQHGGTVVTITDTRFVPIYGEHPEQIIMKMLKDIQPPTHNQIPNTMSTIAKMPAFKSSFTNQQKDTLVLAENLLPEALREMFITRMSECVGDNTFLDCTRDIAWPTIGQFFPRLPSFPSFGPLPSLAEEKPQEASGLLPHLEPSVPVSEYRLNHLEDHQPHQVPEILDLRQFRPDVPSFPNAGNPPEGIDEYSEFPMADFGLNWRKPAPEPQQQQSILLPGYTASVGATPVVPAFPGQPTDILIDIDGDRVILPEKEGELVKKRRKREVYNLLNEDLRVNFNKEPKLNMTESQLLQLLKNIAKDNGEESTKESFMDSLNSTMKDSLTPEQFEILKTLEKIDNQNVRGVMGNVFQCIRSLSFLRCMGIFMWPMVTSAVPSLLSFAGFGGGRSVEDNVETFFGLSKENLEKELLARQGEMEGMLINWYTSLREDKFEKTFGFITFEGYGDGEVGVRFTKPREGRGKFKDNKTMPSILTILSDIMGDVLDKPRRPDNKKKGKGIIYPLTEETERSDNDDSIINLFLAKLKSEATDEDSEPVNGRLTAEDAYQAFEMLFGPKLKSRIMHKLEEFYGNKIEQEGHDHQTDRQSNEIQEEQENLQTDESQSDNRSALTIRLPKLDEELISRKITESIARHFNSNKKNKNGMMMPGIGLAITFVLQMALAHARAAASMASMLSNMAMGSAVFSLVRQSLFGQPDHPKIKYVYDSHAFGPGITWPQG